MYFPFLSWCLLNLFLLLTVKLKYWGESAMPLVSSGRGRSLADDMVFATPTRTHWRLCEAYGLACLFSFYILGDVTEGCCNDALALTPGGDRWIFSIRIVGVLLRSSCVRIRLFIYISKSTLMRTFICLIILFSLPLGGVSLDDTPIIEVFDCAHPQVGAAMSWCCSAAYSSSSSSSPPTTPPRLLLVHGASLDGADAFLEVLNVSSWVLGYLFLNLFIYLFIFILLTLILMHAGPKHNTHIIPPTHTHTDTRNRKLG